MDKITYKELRDKWLNFYKERGHVDVGPVSLIGDGTTGVMFNVAGMQPLMPYLLGEKHPMGTRLCNIQGCVRTIDIEEIGDESHFSFFEMMGNWSLGDYFKKEKTRWTFELLTKEFGFLPEKICATVFEGDENAPRDEETANLLLELGIKKENIYYMPKKDNWWELAGMEGTPCGPDNEWFYPKDIEPCGENCSPACDCGRYVEVGNDVYMQYVQLGNGKYGELKNKNVDTGFGLERNLAFLNGLKDCYRTDIFRGVIKFLEEQSGKNYGDDEVSTKAMRVVADHIRTATMLIGDENGILPSNVGAGYILRRLLRRAIRFGNSLGLEKGDLSNIARIYVNEIYAEAYPRLVEKLDYIAEQISVEEEKFNKTLQQGTKEFNKLIGNLQKFAPDNKSISGDKAFKLFDTFGFPLELTEEMAKEQGYVVDADGFKKCFEEHQAKSKAVEKGTFKSGLEDNSENTIKYHTATHLLNAALKLVFGSDCHQKGSNITAERLRFDFPCDHKLTEEEINQIETIVNGWIGENLKVIREEMPKEKAVEIGAEHQFIERYPDIVSVYSIGEISKEICTGPHVESLDKLGKFKITKEESSSSGVRRIKAILE